MKMTYEEALRLKRQYDRCMAKELEGCLDISCGECEYKYDSVAFCEATDMAFEALEKQIPKRPDRSKNYGFCKCPEGHNIPKVCESGRMRYCPFCGQRIDWSDYK